jgi:hypothetical protein
MKKYDILLKVPDERMWRGMATVSANSARQAIAIFRREIHPARGEKLRAKLRNSGKRKNRSEKRAPKRISASLSRWLKKMNPSHMKGVTHVRVRRLKGGGVSVLPVRANEPYRRRRAKTQRRRRR